MSDGEQSVSRDRPNAVPVGRLLLWYALPFTLVTMFLSVFATSEAPPLAKASIALMGCSGIVVVMAVFYWAAKLTLQRVRD